MDQDRGRPRVLERTGRAHQRRLPLRGRRRLLPRDPHPRRLPEDDLEHLAREGARRRRLPDHPAVLRQRPLLRFPRAARGRPGSRCRSSPASCRSPRSARSSAWPRCAAPPSPTGLRRELHARGEHPEEPCVDFGVAYATLQCAELWPPGAPGIHFYTLNRSPATRAILSALKLARPWERAIYAGGAGGDAGAAGEGARGVEEGRGGRSHAGGDRASGAARSPAPRPPAVSRPAPRSARPPSRSGGTSPRPTRPAASASR